MAPAEFDSQFVYSEAGLGGDSEIQWETAATGLQSLRMAVAPKRRPRGPRASRDRLSRISTGD